MCFFDVYFQLGLIQNSGLASLRKTTWLKCNFVPHRGRGSSENLMPMYFEIKWWKGGKFLLNKKMAKQYTLWASNSPCLKSHSNVESRERKRIHTASWRATFSLVFNVKQTHYKRKYYFRVLEMTYKKPFKRLRCWWCYANVSLETEILKNQCLLCFSFREKIRFLTPYPECYLFNHLLND